MLCCSPAARLIPHNLPLPGRYHALVADGLAVADRQPFRDLATRPAISRAPTFTHHALVLGGRHDHSVLAEGGPQKAQTGPVDEGVAVNVGPAADLEPSTVDTVSLMANTARKLAAMSVQVIASNHVKLSAMPSPAPRPASTVSAHERADRDHRPGCCGSRPRGDARSLEPVAARSTASAWPGERSESPDFVGLK
jgi:hypothetical protein